MWTYNGGTGGRDRLFNGEFPFLAILSDGLVDSTIGTTADKPHDAVLVPHTDFTGIPSA